MPHHEWVSGIPPGFVKVRFNLEAKDEHGWPPMDSEGLWAEPLGDDTYRIDNVPWFVRNLAADDVVDARAGSDDALWAISRRSQSGRLTVRVLPRYDGPLGGNWQAVADAFAPFGIYVEVADEYNLIALDIPPEADLAAIKALLTAGEADGRWHFEEGSINETWRTL